MPLVREILEDLSGAIIYSKIDLKQGFNQLKVKQEDQIKTTFTWKGKQYMFVGAPFGFKNVPSCFQRVIASVFEDLPFVRVYVDDIVIFSTSVQVHAEHVSTVIKRLNKANLRTNAKKCSFAVRSVTLLGYDITPTGYRVSPEKLVAIDNWGYPKTGAQLSKHLGFFNFFREVIPLYSKLSSPLDQLRKVPDLTTVWTPEQQQAYDKIKQALHSSVILSFPDFTKPFLVGTDASDKGIGAILYQEGPQGSKLYISFAARSLSSGEKSYGATKRELAAIVFALKKFRYYLYGQHFTVFTDHKALTYLFTQHHVNPMLLNWLEQILEFSFDIIHLPGVQNILPDALSRFYDADERPSCNTVVNQLVVTDASTSVPIESFDPGYAQEVPEDLRPSLIERAHLAGHFGSGAIAKMLILDNKTWKGMRHDIKKHVSKCLSCQRYNIGKHGFHPLKAIHAELPMDHLAIDLKQLPESEGGFNYILVVVDLCTRFVFLRALKTKSAESIAKKLVHLFCEAGFPRIVQRDNGTEFVNQLLREVCAQSKIDHRLIAAYHARANGLAERFVQTISQTILKILNGQLQTWDHHVPAAQLFVNNKVSAIHNSTPFALMFARTLNGFDDYRQDESRLLDPGVILKRAQYLNSLVYPAINEKVRRNQSQDCDAFNKKHIKRMVDEDYFIPGSLVMAKDETRSSKDQPRYLGPFEVIRRTRGGSYLLKGPGNFPYKRPPNALKLVERVPEAPLAEGHYEVEAILDHRPKDQPFNEHTEYRIRWKGYSESDDTWGHSADFDDLNTVLRYQRSCRYPKRKRQRRVTPKT